MLTPSCPADLHLFQCGTAATDFRVCVCAGVRLRASNSATQHFHGVFCCRPAVWLFGLEFLCVRVQFSSNTRTAVGCVCASRLCQPVELLQVATQCLGV